ncbi:NADPH-dependent oxidoreductase [Adhaeribacter arboris]|uniref:NADPH-dependent oxidoreductase n=1 Tax=Adhaeribacter arboris TaxID=2072846 RepID=A0A2T2YBI8_9BACT|nr:NAD(P)H-dependent oxidoreductase [Adhaeribacter arboris]PSR52877.1 NADPH-dependent oxidoreductase [Adhaeribacter arboris]
MNIEIISGSPRAESVTFRAALYLHRLFTSKTNHHIGLIDVREHGFGLLQKVIVSVEKAPEEHKALAKRMFAADAFILVTPEYNGSYSPALKNLLDHFPKQIHKPFGIVTGSAGVMGGMRASQQMQLLINALFGIASPYMLVIPFIDKKIDAEGNLIEGSFQSNVDTFVQEYVWLAERISEK